MMVLKSMTKNIFFLIFFFVTVTDSNTVFADQQVTIYTPNGSPVIAYIRDEISTDLIDYIDAQVKAQYPNTTFIDKSSSTYNCHGYAWHVSEGGDNVWIGYTSASDEDIYWLDGSYVEVSNQDGDKVSYSSDNHSAVKASENGWFISKWGKGPLMKHRIDDCPYDSTAINYYGKQKTIAAPTNFHIINTN